MAGPDPPALGPSSARGGGGGHTCAIEACGVTSLLAELRHQCTLINLLGLLILRRHQCQPWLMVLVGGWKGVQKFIRRRQISHKEVVNNYHL